MERLTPEFFAFVAAGLSALATLLAAIAAWRAPLSAAKLADRLRRDAEQETENRRLRFYVFTTLMQERASVYSGESVRALNLIDTVFNSSMPVREAWAELYNAFGDKNASEFDKQNKLRQLLREMALDLGIGESLRIDDFGRVYFPHALAEEEEVRMLGSGPIDLLEVAVAA
jgi:hypothetical protein